MARTRIKICGIKDLDTAWAAVDAGADAIGFNFVRSSPRYVEPEVAGDIMNNLPPLVATVGVFMNHSIEAFSDIEEVCPTAHNQFHGNENEAMVKQCAPVIRAIRFDPATIARELERWHMEEVEAYLIDSPVAGSGEKFDWQALAPFMEQSPRNIFLAGGLTPENVGEAIRICRPYAVDVSSGVERERGVKDAALIEAFCDAVREADISIED